MDENKFQSMMSEADCHRGLSGGTYFNGYMTGLRRLHHGESFGTQENHDLNMSLADEDDPDRRSRGQGYRDGFNGIRPNPDRWSYCTQNENDCQTCSLVNYRRDCQNNQI